MLQMEEMQQDYRSNPSRISLLKWSTNRKLIVPNLNLVLEIEYLCFYFYLLNHLKKLTWFSYFLVSDPAGAIEDSVV